MAQLRDALIYTLSASGCRGGVYIRQSVRVCMCSALCMYGVGLVMFFWIQASGYSAGVGAHLVCMSGCNLPKNKKKKMALAYIWSTYIHVGLIPGTQNFLFCSSAHQNPT